MELELAAAAAPRPRILVVEPHAPGHHATYLRWIVEALVERGWTAVVATTKNALEHPLLRDLAGRDGVEVRIIDTPLPVGPISGRLEVIRRELVYWLMIRRVVRDERSKSRLAAAVLPYIDYCFFACCVLGPPERSVPWYAISMRLSAVNAENASSIPWRWRLARRLLSARPLSALFSICPSVQNVPAAWLTGTMAKKLRYLPDPAEHRGNLKRAAARTELGIDDEQLAVLVFGAIDERKGLGRLATALAGDARLAAYVVVVAGAQTPEIRRAMTMGAFAELHDQRRLIVLDRTLDDAEQALVFAAADLVWLGYERHAFMSGVLALAGLAALPVLATRFGEVGAFVERYGMGLCVSPASSDDVNEALMALTNETLRKDLGKRAAAALADHTPQRLKRDLVTAIAAGTIEPANAGR